MWVARSTTATDTDISNMVYYISQELHICDWHLCFHLPCFNDGMDTLVNSACWTIIAFCEATTVSRYHANCLPTGSHKHWFRWFSCTHMDLFQLEFYCKAWALLACRWWGGDSTVLNVIERVWHGRILTSVMVTYAVSNQFCCCFLSFHGVNSIHSHCIKQTLTIYLAQSHYSLSHPDIRKCKVGQGQM